MEYVEQKGYLVHPSFADTNREKTPASSEEAVADFLAAIEILDANEINYCITHGTCLGLIRDQKFIPWDFDADIGVIINEKRSKAHSILSSQFEKNGFTIVKYNLTKTQLGITRNGFIIDLNFYSKVGPFYVARWHHDFINFNKFLGTTGVIRWNGKEIATPARVTDYLISMYGRNWRTPKHYNFRFGRVYLHIPQKIWYLLVAFTSK